MATLHVARHIKKRVINAELSHPICVGFFRYLLQRYLLIKNGKRKKAEPQSFSPRHISLSKRFFIRLMPFRSRGTLPRLSVLVYVKRLCTQPLAIFSLDTHNARRATATAYKALTVFSARISSLDVGVVA